MSVKSLNTLIKIEKAALDELRRTQTMLENQRQSLVDLVGKLQEDLDAEMQNAAENAHLGAFFGNFAQRIKKRQDAIRVEVLALNKQLQELGVKISHAFGEVKKLEIARDNRIKAAAEEKSRKEDQEQDAVAMQQFIRKE